MTRTMFLIVKYTSSVTSAIPEIVAESNTHLPTFLKFLTTNTSNQPLILHIHVKKIN